MEREGGGGDWVRLLLVGSGGGVSIEVQGTNSLTHQKKSLSIYLFRVPIKNKTDRR